MRRRDVFTKRKRSAVMSKIRGKGSKLDLTMRKLLENAGIDFEMYPEIFGRPDFLVRPNVALFCDSSFWHGRDWPELRKKLRLSPDPQYWIKHIERNIRRDRAVTRRLRAMGFKVLRLWDDTVFKNPRRVLARVLHAVNGNSVRKAVSLESAVTHRAPCEERDAESD